LRILFSNCPAAILTHLFTPGFAGSGGNAGRAGNSREYSALRMRKIASSQTPKNVEVENVLYS